VKENVEAAERFGMRAERVGGIEEIALSLDKRL